MNFKVKTPDEHRAFQLIDIKYYQSNFYLDLIIRQLY